MKTTEFKIAPANCDRIEAELAALRAVAHRAYSEWECGSIRDAIVAMEALRDALDRVKEAK